MTPAEAATIQRRDQNEGFARFMEQPATKALISTIKPSEHLEALLRSAFESGYGCGCVSTTMAIIKIAGKSI